MKPWIKILVGLASGIIVGFIIGHPVDLLERVGKAFIDLLKMLVGLIIFSSLVTGMCHISDPKALGRMGIRTVAYYWGTAIIAILFGVLLAFTVKPGVGLKLPLPPRSTLSVEGIGLSDFFFSIVPSNPFAAFAEGNVLQIIVFAILFAVSITLAGEKGKPILTFFESLSEIMYSLTHFIMKCAPYGIFALIATAVGSIGLKVILPLFKFLLCCYVACFLQLFIVFCGSIKYLAKLRVAPFFKGMKDAIVLAFTTSSSSATLPVSMECAKNHLGISPDISGFVLSLGSTINMDGAAIGQAVSAIFIAQAYGIPITWVKVIILVFVSLISAIGAAGIPGTGIIMLSVVLNAMGLPLEGIALVAGVDRIREMMSTVTNILGDAVAAVFIAKTENRIDERRYHDVTWSE